MLNKHKTVADKYSDIWRTLNDEGLSNLLHSDPTLRLPSYDIRDIPQEVLDYHIRMFDRIRKIPLTELKVTLKYSHETRIPIGEEYSLRVYTMKDEMIFLLRISIIGKGLISSITVLDSFYSEIEKKYCDPNNVDEQQTLNTSEND